MNDEDKEDFRDALHQIDERMAALRWNISVNYILLALSGMLVLIAALLNLTSAIISCSR